jgi:molybdopterin synthase catalytic subunit
MTVKVLFFGLLKDVVGRSEDAIELPAEATMGTLFERYASQYPRLHEMADSIALARNHEFTDLDVVLSDGDEVALMPPVSGGSDARSGWLAEATDDNGSFYAVTREPIDSPALAGQITTDADGAVITFEGVVRNNSKGRTTKYLDYECYIPMALKTMRQLGGEIVERHDVNRVAIVHRLGRLEIGEASVSIIVASAHRQAAFDASLEAINRLKKIVPVWKKEYFEDGEVWVEGDWEEAVPRPAGAVR